MYLLWPLSLIYRCICLGRALPYRYFYRVPHWPVPIIVIGNLTVGGTGKTPVVMGLLAFLKSKNLRVAVIARGYKSQAEYAQAPVLISEESSAVDVGDEALLIFKEMQVPVSVHHQRVRAVQALLAAHPDLDVILSDDGLQHLKLPRELEIVVVDGQRQLGNGFLLPAGPLREPASRLSTVDCVVQSGVDFNLIPQILSPLHVGCPEQSLAFLHGKQVHGVAGIGHPERFFASLRALGAEVITHVFPDHHAFVETDFAGFSDAFIVMTAKDAVKCVNFNLPQGYVLKTQVKLAPVFEDAFWQKLRYIMRLERQSD
jgi:tetraacyldisaccharide 4'-kinase